MTDTVDKKKVTFSTVALASILIFVIAQTANISAWKSDVEMNQQQQKESLQEYMEQNKEIQRQYDVIMNDLEKRQTACEIQNAKIETKLVNIESLLVEIKVDLRDAKNNN